MTSDAAPPSATDPAAVPLPLRVACLVAAAEGVVLAVYAVVLLLNLTGERVTMGVTSSGFLAVYGAFLVFAAYRLSRLDSWARAPLVMAQLIQGLVGFSFWGGSTVAVGVALVGSAAVALVGIFHPRSIVVMAEAD